MHNLEASFSVEVYNVEAPYVIDVALLRGMQQMTLSKITTWRQVVRGTGLFAIVPRLTAGFLAAWLLCQGEVAQAQGNRGESSAVDSSGYLKAESLVNNGDAAEGRAMVDSLFARAKPGTPQYVEGLYWRAKLAASADAAQKDYLRIILEYSNSPRVPDARLNLGQLEFVRGQRDKARQHFERLRYDFPGHVLQATATYWYARTLIEANDLERGCLANAEALTLVLPGNIELQNRIKFQNQRCRGVEIAFKDSSTQSTEDSTDAPSEVANEPATDGKTIPVKGSTAAGKPAPTVSDKPPAAASSSKTASGERYAVQVAAFKTKAQASALVESLKKKGYTARVDGTTSPYRVKIGRFTTRSGAEALLAELKARKIDGFITKG